MGSGGYQIHGLPGGYSPKISEKGVDIYGGPRGSLAGTLPSWIAWWTIAYRYEPGHIVYMPGVYVRDYNASGEVITSGNFTGGQGYEDASNGKMSDRRNELSWDQDIAVQDLQEEGDLTGGSMSRGSGEVKSSGAKQYFEYGSHTLWVKLFGGQDNSATNDSSLNTDLDFFDVNKRRKNGWYCFYELMRATDPVVGGNLEIAFPQGYNIQSNQWDNNKKRYTVKVSGQETLKVVYGSWGENLFRQIPCEKSSATEIEVFHDETILNMCDTFALLASTITPNKNLVNFVVCKSVLRSPGSLGEDESTSPIEVAILPTDKITIGGNVLRSPQKIKVKDNVDSSFVSDIGDNFFKDEQGNDEEMTMISAGYPGIINPEALLHSARNASDINQKLTNIAKGDVSASDTIVGDSALDSEQLYLDKIKFGKMPAYDPRFGEAATSLNSFISSVYNFSLPMSTSASIDFWEPNTLYRLGKAVRLSPNSSEYNASEQNKNLKDVVWVCKKEHTSGDFASSECPPLGTGGARSLPEVFENTYWRTYGVLANQPNSSLLQLNDLYRDSEIFVPTINVTKSSSENISLGEGAFERSLLGSSRRIRMSEMSGGSRLYASLTISPARKFDVRYYRKRNSWGRRRTVTFRFPPSQSDAAQADLWLYSNNFRRDHAGSINFAVTFVEHTGFVWAQAKKVKSAWFGILIGLAFAVVGMINPALFMTVGLECAAFGFGGGLAVGALGGAIGLGIGTALGASAEAVYASLGKGVGRKKAFTRSSFSRIVSKIADDAPTLDYVLDRSGAPSNGVVIGKNSSDVSNDLYDSNAGNNTQSENDIIRFNFGNLYPYLFESKHNNTIHVTGEYQFLIQDLNSAQTIKVGFKYEEISRRSSRSYTDSFGNSFSGYPRGTPESPHASADSSLYNAYVNAANEIISGGVTSTADLKLIATRNYFNYLLIGQENVRDTNDPLQALTMWSVDLSDAQFSALTGMMQTGFRDLVFDGSGSFSNQDGLSDYHEFYTENPPIAAAENVAAPGYELEIENNSIKAVKDLNTNRRVGIVENVAQAQGLDRQDAEVLAKGLAPGEFKLGKELKDSTPQYINFLNTPALTDSIKWEDIQSGIKVNGGSIIEYDSEFYFVNATFVKNSQSLTEVATLVPGSSSSIYTADSFSPSLTLTKQWQRMIESEFYFEEEHDRGPNFYVENRKLDFSFIVKESADSSLVNLFLFGFSDFVPRFSLSNFRTYFVDSVATISVQRPIKDVSGQLMGEGTASWSSEDTKDTQAHVFRLKEDIPDKENPSVGTIPGFKDESSWEYIGMPPDLSNNAFDWSLPVLNEINEFSPGDNLLTGSRTRSIGFLTSASERFRLSPSDTIDTILDRSDASTINFPWIKRSSQESNGTYVTKQDRNGNTVHILCPFNTTNQDQWNLDNISSRWKTVMSTILDASNTSHILDAYLTNELDTARSFSNGGQDLTYIQFVISPVSDLISSLEVWDASKDYSTGDIVAFHHTNYHYIEKSTGNISSRANNYGKFWMFAKANQNIVANTKIPLFDDNTDPGSVLGKSYSEIGGMILPIETKYWECTTAREGTGKEAVTSAIGSKKLSKSYYGTDLDVKSYGISMGAADTYGTKTTTPYSAQQRMIYNNNVNTDFSNPNNLIFTTTISEDAKIVGRLPTEAVLYKSEGGTWPGTLGDVSSTYLERSDWANLYPENQLISLFLQRTVNAGAKWTTWLDAFGSLAYGDSNKNNAYQRVTFSQGDEFNKFQTIPNVTLGVSKDGGSTFDSFESYRNFDPDYPVFHRGYSIPIGLKASVTNSAGLIVAPSSVNGSNLYGYASCLVVPGESVDGGRYGKITYVHQGAGDEVSQILNSSSSSINNTEISQKFRTLASGDRSGVIGYGPEVLSNEFDIHGISGIDMNSLASAFSVKLPEKCGTREIVDLCTQKCVLVLAIRDSSDGTTKNRTRFRDFYQNGTGINFQFDNWFARRNSSGSYTDSFGESWPDNMVEHGEDSDIIKVQSKLNTASEAINGLIDVCGAEGGDSHKDKLINLGNSETHYHGFEQEFLPYDDIGLAYITEILKGAGQFIGAAVDAGFNASGNYIGGTGLTQATMASAEFMAISQPAFEEGLPNSNTGMHGKPPVQTKMYFYSDSNYDFKFDVSIPSLLYKKYINNNDSSDVINKNYYDTLFDSNSPGGGDAKNNFYEEYVFSPEFKIYLNNSLINTYNHSSSEFSEINGYIGRFTLNKARLGNPSNGSTIKFTIDDGISCPHGANFKELILTAEIIEPPSFSAMENNINNKMYYYTDDSHVYSFGVNFPNSATFGGRVVINDGSADQIFESDSGPPNVTFTGPSAGSTQITVTIDDGIPYGFGRARTGAPQHNLVYPASLNPVQILPIEKIPIGDISLNLHAGGDGFIANKAIGIPPNQSFETINKQYIYNKYNYEYSGLNAGIPAFNVSDNADRDYFASRSSITSVSTGVSTQMERKASMFPFHPDFAGITLKEDMFPEAEEGTVSFTIQDGTLLSSPRSSAQVEIPYIRINRPCTTITGVSVAETFKLWDDSPLVASGSFHVEGLVSCSEWAEIKIMSARGQYILSDEDGLERPPVGGFTNFRWDFVDYDLNSVITGEADLIDGLYVTILDRKRGPVEGDDTWETFDYTISEAIDLFLVNNEYESNYASGSIFTTNPLERIRFSKSVNGTPLTVRVQDNILNDNGIIDYENFDSTGQASSADVPLYSKLENLVKYEDQSDNLVRNRMGGQFNVIDKNWITFMQSLEDFKVRRYSAASSTLLYSSYAELRPLRINYLHSAGELYTKTSYETGARSSYDEHDARIAYNPSRSGSDEPSIWASHENSEDWNQYCTNAISNGAIDLCPNAMGDLIWSDDAKWLQHEDSDFVPSPDDPSGRYYNNFVIWHPKNYKGEDSWEIINQSDVNDEYESDMSFPDFVGLDNSFDMDQDWFPSSRLMGWRLTCPHLNFIQNLENCTQDEEKRYLHLIKNGSNLWGGLSLSDIWKTDSSGDTSENWFGYNRKSYIGLHVGLASRITKFVYGLSPGVTYRLYLSAAYRPDYAPSGVRVYVCEPDQSQSETGDLSHELIAYGEFTCNASRSIDYNAKNHFGGRGVQTNFTKNKPFSGNTSEGSTTISNDNAASLHSKVGEDGFRVYYVEFTPTLGSGIVEVRIENAFVSETYNNVGRSSLSEYDYTWQAPTQSDMFNVSADWFSSSRKNWTEYSGVWASNGIVGDTTDGTAFIGDVFIRSVRPLYAEALEFNASCAQGGYEIIVKNGDTENSTIPKSYLRSPNAYRDVFKKMKESQYGGPSLDIFENDYDSFGWFQSDTDYVVHIIRPHPYLLNWDPFAVDAQNFPAVGSNQGYIAKEFVPDVFGDSEHGVYDLDAVVDTESVEALYQIMLGRESDTAGKDAKINDEMTVDEVIDEMLGSSEYADNKASRNLPDDPRPSMIKDRHFHPNLMTGFYLGHVCFYNEKIWRIAKPNRKYSNSDYTKRRPGYDNWNWEDGYEAYMPQSNSNDWENISSFTSQEIFSDAAVGTGAYHNSSLNLVKVYSSVNFTESDRDMMWSAHFLDSFFRRPFIQEHLKEGTINFIGDLGKINDYQYTMLIGENPQARAEGDSSELPEFRLGDVFQLSSSDTSKWTDAAGWATAGVSIPTNVERTSMLSLGTPFAPVYSGAVYKLGGISSSGTSAEFVIYKGGWGQTVGPNYPIVQASFYDSATSLWSTQHGAQEFLMDPISLNLSSSGQALNASQTKRMIGNPNHSVSYAFGIGTAIEFSSRGDSRSSRIELPINVGSNGSNSVPYIGDNYYGGANPIPHHGLAHRVNNAGYLNDYPTYNSSTDRYKYSSATLDRAFDERQRRNLI